MKRALILAQIGASLLTTACSVANNRPALPSPVAPDAIEPTSLAPLPMLALEEIALGQKAYAENCAECHGDDLEGEANWKTQNTDKSFRAPPHTADGHTWHHPDDQLLDAVRRGGTRFEGINLGGSSNMPAYDDILTDREIMAVLTYIKSSWPDDIRTIQWQQTLQTQSTADGQQ